MKQWLIAVPVIAALVASQWWLNNQNQQEANTARTASAVPTQGDSPRMYMLDSTRVINAQRKLLSESLFGNENAVTTTAYAGRQAEEVIRNIVGPNAVVLVKQAVIVAPAHIEDITDRVLTELQLPDTGITQKPLSDKYMLRGNQYADSDVYETLRDSFEEKRKGWEQQDAEDAQAYLP